MLDDLLLGILVYIAVMLIHLGATFLLVALIRPYGHWLWERPHLRLTLALLGANVLLLAAHLMEVGLWATLYSHLDLVDNAADAYYSAFLNYTTLGSGEAHGNLHTRLLDPIAAGSGILMFGWSTALLIYVLQGHVHNLITTRRIPNPGETARSRHSAGDEIS
ncbi:two pore domain potassium channel family protein [Ancylobacter sp. VNQ12]|uniref:two pore domain potassium channel family protein n=1 Tax=Ancylobacter sp. VNQ12 TaxID=3400920 RepID=UPI003C071BA8